MIFFINKRLRKRYFVERKVADSLSLKMKTIESTFIYGIKKCFHTFCFIVRKYDN